MEIKLDPAEISSVLRRHIEESKVSVGMEDVGEVIEGMEIVDAFNDQYGDLPTNRQGEIHEQGNAFLDETFPGLDYIITAELILDAPATP